MSDMEYNTGTPVARVTQPIRFQSDASGNLKVAPQASESVIGAVVGKSTVVDVTFTTDTSAYVAGDLLADTQAMANVTRIAGGISWLQTVQLTDESDQKQPLDIVFLDANTSMGTENSAPNISDANASAAILGVVSIAAADYKDIGGASIASLRGVALALKAAAASTTIYVALISEGTGTYGATALKAKFGFTQD